MNNEIKTLLETLGVTHIGEVAVADMLFNPAFRAACGANQCGKYGTTWTCPPGVGEPATLEAYARRFIRGLVVQTVWPLQDVFDFDGMMAGAEKHNALFHKVVTRVVPLLRACPGSADETADVPSPLALSAGACSVCETCTYPSGEPCRHPERAMASLEAYCIDVAALIERAGLRYANGPNTVSYVGLILYGFPPI